VNIGAKLGFWVLRGGWRIVEWSGLAEDVHRPGEPILHLDRIYGVSGLMEYRER